MIRGQVGFVVPPRLDSFCDQIPTRAPALEQPAHRILLYICGGFADDLRPHRWDQRVSVFGRQQNRRGRSMAGLVSGFGDDPEFFAA
jgi:hypothetical protein